jgi:hypothetical protein
MSAGKNRPSRPSYRLPRHAAVISAAACANVRSAPRGSSGFGPFAGAVPGCLVTPASGSGAEAPGDSTR